MGQRMIGVCKGANYNMRPSHLKKYILVFTNPKDKKFGRKEVEKNGFRCTYTRSTHRPRPLKAINDTLFTTLLLQLCIQVR